MQLLSLVSRWPAERMAARPALRPYPGWVLGSGERQGLRVWLRRQVWKWVPREIEIVWLNSLRLWLQPGNETSRAIFLTGRYEPNEFCVLDRALLPGMTFVDVGANMGLYSLFAAKKVLPQGWVLALEPSSREYELLKRNVQLNGLQNVRALRVAASDRSGTAELLIAPLKNAGHNTLGAFGYDTALERKEVVPLERLDDVMRKEGVQRVEVIKIDVEGAELLVLRGAVETLRRFHPLLLLELSERTLRHQGSSAREVLDFLKREGYRIYGFDERTGLPSPLQRQPPFNSENILAVAEEGTP